ncbi:Very-long-chain (3R)-3-hydroxyacyl-CoA dehydratase 2 [Smittium mucronatum]|uniref:Very-long-chain (3R)-3-hydroxyacyl-CoA dehydratase n=1 Tax=Smittium mucronatum TaxID=133383 RepID=A0A1R0GWC2_9FUNG|nr:Very-long-chain (3R)-3-hydroxyacyl-CoA dehydratase 2 [Smittium mucronatum]
MTVLPQVFSRLFLVWGIFYVFPEREVLNQIGVPLLVFAWSITETIRYPFYALSVAELQFYPLLWARYTLFYVLYPLGVTGELLTIYSALPIAKNYYPTYYYFLIAIMFSYGPPFYFLYTHMIKQRRKQLGSPKQSSDKKEGKNAHKNTKKAKKL